MTGLWTYLTPRSDSELYEPNVIDDFFYEDWDDPYGETTEPKNINNLLNEEGYSVEDEEDYDDWSDDEVMY